MNSVRIISTGISIPSNILSNSDLEKMVDTSDEWITTRTGIKERRIVDKDKASSNASGLVGSTRVTWNQLKMRKGGYVDFKMIHIFVFLIL